VCLLLALCLYVAERGTPAIVFGVGGLASLVVAAVFWFRSRVAKAAVSMATTQKIGNGPYAERSCKQGGEFVQTLSGILEELRAAAKDSNWDIRWQDVDAFRLRAEEAAANRKFPEAVRQYAGAIRLFMQRLRRQQRDKASDSEVEL
jgi:hypothetical protein